MSFRIMKSYEKPTVETIDAADLIEQIGPAQGYGIAGTPGAVDSPLTAMDPTNPRHFGRN